MHFSQDCIPNINKKIKYLSLKCSLGFTNCLYPPAPQGSSAVRELYDMNIPCFGAWNYGGICCTLRSGLHEIPTMIRNLPHGFENNHECKWISDNLLRILTYVLLLENCQKSACMHGCSPIHVESFFFFLKVWDRFVP